MFKRWNIRMFIQQLLLLFVKILKLTRKDLKILKNIKISLMQ